MAEDRLAPRAMHSLELRVLCGSIWKTYETVLMKIGILDPPPISQIEARGMFDIFRCYAHLRKNCFIWERTGSMIAQNCYLFIVQERSHYSSRQSMLKSYSEFPERIFLCFSMFYNNFIVAFLLQFIDRSKLGLFFSKSSEQNFSICSSRFLHPTCRRWFWKITF